jgi:hypothetical protein
MKSIFTLLIFLPLQVFAQQYSEVVEVPGKTADQLYTSARIWFAERFKSANDVLQMDDQTSGTMVGKGSMRSVEVFIVPPSVAIKNEWLINFTIKVMVKDGRFKCDMYDFLVTSYSNDNAAAKDTPLKEYLDQKEYYKNGSDPDYLKKAGVKFPKVTAPVNQSIYNHIVKFENEIPNFYSSLKKSMSAMDTW